MKQRRNQSLHMNVSIALQLATACGIVCCTAIANPCWGQSALPATASGASQPRVVSLPPPPGTPLGTAANTSKQAISTPAHVPIPVGIVAIPNAQFTSSPALSSSPELREQANKPQAAAESLIEGMEQFIPPLPAAQLPTMDLPPAQKYELPALPGLPALPNGAPPFANQVNNQAAAAAGTMPRMSSPNSTTISGGAGAVGIPPAKNSLASHSSPPIPGSLTGFDLSTATSLEKNSFRASEPEEFPAGRLIAVVGYEHILAGDMAVFVEPIIQQNKDKIPSADEEKKIRKQLTRQALRQYVEIKAIYHEFFRDMVGSVPPKEFADTKKKVITRAGKIFFEKQVPVLMEKYEVQTIAELEQKLMDKSLSLGTLRGQFIEQVLASELERKFVPDKFEIDRHDLVDAYRQEKDSERWNVAGRARWRQLTVRFDKHSTREEAMARIRELGNEVYYGKAFEAVAKQSSEGYSASEGGVYDWTTQGSLKSKPLDEALFTLPPNSLSQIIEDDIGLHIVEVLEREAGHVKDFTEAQAELRESLSEERRRKEIRTFRERIMNRTTVWTLWPEDIPDSRPLSEALGDIE